MDIQLEISVISVLNYPYIFADKKDRYMQNDNINNFILDVGVSAIEQHFHDIGYSDDDIILLNNIKELEQTMIVRVQMNAILFCLGGRLQFDVDNETYTLTEGKVFACHSKAVISNIMSSNKYSCKVLLFTDKALQYLLHSDVVLWNKALYIQKIRIFSLTEDEIKRGLIYEQLVRSRINRNSQISRTIIHTLFSAVLLEFCEMMFSRIDKDAVPNIKLRSKEIFHRFIDLLSQETAKKHSVAYYAEKMYITPKYLSMICKQISDKSPLQWITEYEIGEIRSYLKNTDLSCKEISDIMGFANSSFFGHYVKEHTGMTPNEYRMSIRK